MRGGKEEVRRERMWGERDEVRREGCEGEEGRRI